MVGDTPTEGFRQRRPQTDAHESEHFADEFVLVREVIDHNSVADPETAGQAPERELAQPILVGSGECGFENLFL